MTGRSTSTTGQVNGAAEAPARRRSPDEWASMTEADLTPQPEAEVRGTCFAPIPGLKIVEFRAPSRNCLWDPYHSPHGWLVVDEPCKGMTPRVNHDGHPAPLVQRVGARIPGDVQPGEQPVDTASGSLLFPCLDGLNLSEVERSCDDTRHIMRGGPYMASR
ncbi:MAG: hypothetical protein ACYDAG_13210 [Chloroflexota bacterium]